MHQNVDLRILPLLETLLTTASVSETARRHGVDPAAVSRALGKARQAFGDDLLVRSGRGMTPTRRGADLSVELRGILERLDYALRPKEGFDIRKVQRVFRIRCDDVFSGLLGARLHEVICREAPGINLQLVPEAPDDENGLRDGRFDMALGGDLKTLPETIFLHLGYQRLVGICRAGHRLLDAEVTSKQLAGHQRVVAQIQLQHERIMRDASPCLATELPIGLVTPSHFSAATIVSKSELIAVLPEILALMLVDPLRLAIFPLPAGPPAVRVGLIWHPRDTNDPAHRWVRDHITRLTKKALRQIGLELVGATFDAAESEP